jgi:hypothetical protein
MKYVISIILIMISTSSFARNHEEAVELAKLYLDRALSSQYVAGDIKLKHDLILIRDRFNDPMRIKNHKCAGRFSNYVAYVLPSDRSKDLAVFICEKYKYLPTESMAQTLIHEVSHLVIGPDEHVATRYEMVATYLGGRTPELNGYNSRQIIFEILEDLSDANLKSRNMDYFVLMNVRTKLKLRVLLLRTFAIYEKCTQFQEALRKLCSSDSQCEEDILSKKDEFGLSILDLNQQCRSQGQSFQ